MLRLPGRVLVRDNGSGCLMAGRGW